MPLTGMARADVQRTRVSEWRWRESNPRLPNSRWGFSERSRWFGLGTTPPSGRLRAPQPRWMSGPAPRPCRPVSHSAWCRIPTRVTWIGATSPTKRRGPSCRWRISVFPALSRRSGDVGSLHPPRPSRSKPRTPLSSSAVPRCVWERQRRRTTIVPARGVARSERCRRGPTLTAAWTNPNRVSSPPPSTSRPRRHGKR